MPRPVATVVAPALSRASLGVLGGLPAHVSLPGPWHAGGLRQGPEVAPESVLRALALLSLVLALVGTMTGLVALD